jgi:hypothetical protein
MLEMNRFDRLAARAVERLLGFVLLFATEVFADFINFGGEIIGRRRAEFACLIAPMVEFWRDQARRPRVAASAVANLPEFFEQLCV